VIQELTLIVGMFVVVVGALLAFLFEYRIRRPDSLVLYESQGQIGLRQGPFYPRHFSLVLKRTTHPIQFTVEATARGNLGVRVKISGSVGPSPDHISALIRVGGWEQTAVTRAAAEAQIFLDGLVKEYTERSEIHTLSSTALLEYLNQRSDQLTERFGLEVITLAVQSLDPIDPEIADALRRQEQARLMAETERLHHQARIEAARAKYEADEEITRMEHELELKKAELESERFEKEAALARQRLEEELARNRQRLAFEREELEMLRSSPELLLLTPQAARLAEASQGLKNARTVISLSPQDLAQGTELLGLFQNMMQRALESRKSENA